MARNDPTAAALDKLGTLRREGDSPETAAELRNALRHKSNFVVARAAKIIAELRLNGLVADLVAAFDRLFPNAPKSDKGCAALTEIVAALYELDHTEPEVYRRAIRYVQMEGSFGPPVDVASKLRGVAAQGLVRTRDPQAKTEVVNLLVDKEVPARLGAVRALATNGGEAGMLLLRLKVLAGDDEPEVLAECFSGLLAYGPESLPFLAEYADSDDTGIAEAAILALGASRTAGALDVLKRQWERTAYAPIRKLLLTAIASNRSDEAADFLLQLLQSENIAMADNVLVALAAYRSNERIRTQALRIVEQRGDRLLLDTFRREF